MGTAHQQLPRTCADCGALSENFLCEDCSSICDQLTPAGRYRAYRVVQGKPVPILTERKDRPFLESGRLPRKPS